MASNPEPTPITVAFHLDEDETQSLFGIQMFTYVITEDSLESGLNQNQGFYEDLVRMYYSNALHMKKIYELRCNTYGIKVVSYYDNILLPAIQKKRRIQVINRAIPYDGNGDALDRQLERANTDAIKSLPDPPDTNPADLPPPYAEVMEIETKKDDYTDSSKYMKFVQDEYDVYIPHVTDHQGFLQAFGEEEYELRFKRGGSRYHSFTIENDLDANKRTIKIIKPFNVAELMAETPDEHYISESWDSTHVKQSQQFLIRTLIKLDYLYDNELAMQQAQKELEDAEKNAATAEERASTALVVVPQKKKDDDEVDTAEFLRETMRYYRVFKSLIDKVNKEIADRPTTPDSDGEEMNVMGWMFNDDDSVGVEGDEEFPSIYDAECLL